MMSTRERVVTTLADLSETQMRQVADFLEFLKFRERQKQDSPMNDATLEALYAEFADEDRELSEAGLGFYVANLELVLAYAKVKTRRDDLFKRLAH